jgi:hypothetical protein
MSPSNGRNEICEVSVFKHVTERIAVITVRRRLRERSGKYRRRLKDRALVVLRFLLNRMAQTPWVWLNATSL